MRSHNSQFRRHCGLRWQKCNSQKPQSVGAKVCKHAVATLCIRQFCLKKKNQIKFSLSKELYVSYTVSFSMLPRWAEIHKRTRLHVRNVYFIYREFWCIFWHEFMPKWLVFHVIFCSCLSVWSCVRITAHCMHLQGIHRYEFHTMKRRKISSI